MKKILFVVIVFCLCLCGCNNETADNSVASVTVRKAYSDFEITLDEDDAKELLSIINDSEWDNGCYKFRGEYRFIIDGKESTIEYYSEMGLFLDHTQDKQLFLTEQQKEYINSIFKITDN